MASKERDLQINRETVKQGNSKDRNLGVMREVVRSLFPTSKNQNLQVFREVVVPFATRRTAQPQFWIIT